MADAHSCEEILPKVSTPDVINHIIRWTFYDIHPCLASTNDGAINLYLYLSLRPGRRAKYCHQLVCLCVCESVCVCLSASISLEPLDRSPRNFCPDPLWPPLGPPVAALRYVMYFRFYG